MEGATETDELWKQQQVFIVMMHAVPKWTKKLTFDIEMILVSHQSPHTILLKMTINVYVQKLIWIIGGGGWVKSLHVFIVMCIFYYEF